MTQQDNAPERKWTESDRLAALDYYDIMDSPPEGEFDDLVRLAADICGVPVALISLVDERRQWFKASIGLDLRETPREQAFCAHAIQQDGPMVVPDATLDARFVDNPLVTGETGLRFYAGAPLVTADGTPLGTLCVLDHEPRQLTDAQSFALTTLSRQVMAQLELRKALALSKIVSLELAHRIKNTVAMAQAIVAQSLRKTNNIAAAGTVIEQRLQSLGQAHEILSQTAWETASIAAVVTAATASHVDDPRRMTFEGPDLEVNSRAAVGLALALHELSTNAVKYGALSTETGEVRIHWRAHGEGDDAVFEVEWAETGGPPVRPPTHQGFGTRLIGASLSGGRDSLNAIEYPSTGVVWRARSPLSQMLT